MRSIQSSYSLEFEQYAPVYREVRTEISNDNTPKEDRNWFFNRNCEPSLSKC